jgi:hypothetical protein
MAIKNREYLFTTNEFNEPMRVKDKSAIALLLIRLILLDPGSDPLHPDMGVGIRDYRYSLNQLEELRKRVEEQIDMFLPDFESATVALIATPDRVCNIEISIDDTTYVYDSNVAPRPIRLDDIADIDIIEGGFNI